MFSFTGDTVVDPFAGTATTTIAAIRCNRNSIANELDPCYFGRAESRVRREIQQHRVFEDGPSLVVQFSNAQY